jgi:hypothetical protein
MYSCVFRPWVITSFGKRGEPTFGDVYRHDRSMIDPAEILVDIVVFGVSSVARTNLSGRHLTHELRPLCSSEVLGQFVFFRISSSGSLLLSDK